MMTENNNPINNNPCNIPQDALELQLSSALERAPEVTVPMDFASRVRASLPPQPAPRRTFRFGPAVALAAAVLVTIAMFVLAPHAQIGFTSLNFYVELLLIAELGGIAYWLVAKQGLRG